MLDRTSREVYVLKFILYELIDTVIQIKCLSFFSHFILQTPTQTLTHTLTLPTYFSFIIIYYPNSTIIVIKVLIFSLPLLDHDRGGGLW